jgi:hypothetical protein
MDSGVNIKRRMARWGLGGSRQAAEPKGAHTQCCCSSSLRPTVSRDPGSSGCELRALLDTHVVEVLPLLGPLALCKPVVNHFFLPRPRHRCRRRECLGPAPSKALPTCQSPTQLPGHASCFIGPTPTPGPTPASRCDPPPFNSCPIFPRSYHGLCPPWEERVGQETLGTNPLPTEGQGVCARNQPSTWEEGPFPSSGLGHSSCLLASNSSPSFFFFSPTAKKLLQPSLGGSITAWQPQGLLVAA